MEYDAVKEDGMISSQTDDSSSSAGFHKVVIPEIEAWKSARRLRQKWAKNWIWSEALQRQRDKHMQR